MNMDKPMVELVGQDGNAFAMLGKCQRAARTAEWEKARIDAFMEEATSGDYDHLLQTVMSHFEVA